MIRIRTVTIFFVVLLAMACRREEQRIPTGQAPFLRHTSQTVDSVLAQMTLTEKIGQLIFVEVDHPTDKVLEEIVDGIALQQIGGVDLRGLPLDRYLDWKDSLEALSKQSLFWGSREQMLLNGHFSDVESLPMAAAVRSISDDTLRSAIDQLHYRQLTALQINWCATPDPDQEQFGRVSELTGRRMLGVAGWSGFEQLLRQDLPADETSRSYRAQVASGVSGVRVPWRPIIGDSLANRTEFLSWKLRQQTGFDGLLTGEWSADVDPVAFLLAGVDQLIVGADWRAVFLQARQAVQTGKIAEEAIDRKVRKVLLAKDWTRGPEQAPALVVDGPKVAKASMTAMVNPGKDAPVSVSKLLREHFNDPDWVVLKHALYHQSMVLLSNPGDRLPFDLYQWSDFRIAQYSQQSFYYFKKQFEKYAGYQSHLIKPEENGALKEFASGPGKGAVNIVLLDQPVQPNRDAAFIKSIRQAAAENPLVLINFGPARNLQAFDPTLAVIQIYERNEITERMAAQLLFGGLDAQGRLPETINESFAMGSGLRTIPSRLAYGLPQEVGVAPEKLVGIDAIMNSAIDDRVIPGGQVLVAKDGKVIYSKAFGYHTFQRKQEVGEQHLYDVASITKVAATTLVAMQLYDLGKYQLNDRLGAHLELLPEATISDIPIKRLLIHQSGLQSNLPIAPFVYAKGGPAVDCEGYFCRERNDTFSIQVAKDFYFNHFYQDTLWHRVQSLRLRYPSGFRYSDVNFMLVQRLIEAKTEAPLDQWTADHFYRPLGLRFTTFNPLNRFEAAQIVPTQIDQRWRKQLLTGYVHDESAALLGGVGGSAGLFTTAEELAVIFQMLLNKGVYGGRRYLNAATVDLFTSDGHGNHRGLGFDKPSARTRNPSYAAAASAETFGHTGFTGTCVWADPEHDLVYIFLANRVYPNGSNRAFFKSNIRQRIHEVIYDALGTFNPQLPFLPETRDLAARQG